LKVLWEIPRFSTTFAICTSCKNISQIPRPSPEAVKPIIEQMAETNPQVAKLRPEQLIDARFFQEL